MRKAAVLFSLILVVCCGRIPHNATLSDALPDMAPDYSETVIPRNIAPLCFNVSGADKCVTVFSNGTYQYIAKGNSVSIPMRKWRRLLDGASVSVCVFTENGGKWTRHREFRMTVSDQIDRYVSYRLIPPSYQYFGQMSLRQRDLTSFNERLIYSNAMGQDRDKEQCVNCHHFRNYKTDNMQFHVRIFNGGTILVRDGEPQKINLKTDSTLSAGVYPTWHPTHNLIAYSVNNTTQRFHTADRDRVEVLDIESDLILYDIDNNEVSIIENDSDQFECFPAWAPDGRTLYYVSAGLAVPDSVDRAEYLYANYDHFHYDLYSKSFDPDTGKWGEPQMVLDASSINRSITLPRVSPDGRYLVFTMARHGVFHIWHTDADLYMIDLRAGTVRPLSEINSNEVESYHSWSSNGKWMVFSSRRGDSNHTRLYLTHLENDGHFSKPFPVPQEDPERDAEMLMSYNIPEFTVEPVGITAHKFGRLIRKSHARGVTFRPTSKD